MAIKASRLVGTHHVFADSRKLHDSQFRNIRRIVALVFPSARSCYAQAKCPPSELSAMSDNKTKPTTAAVSDYLQSRANAQQLADCQQLIDVMQQLTGEQPVMWGPSIVGFGSYHYRYESGRTGNSCLLGFAVRGRDLVLYLALDQQADALLAALPVNPKRPLKLGKGCLYFKQLADLQPEVLRQLLHASMTTLQQRYL